MWCQVKGIFGDLKAARLQTPEMTFQNIHHGELILRAQLQLMLSSVSFVQLAMSGLVFPNPRPPCVVPAVRVKHGNVARTSESALPPKRNIFLGRHRSLLGDGSS